MELPPRIEPARPKSRHFALASVMFFVSASVVLFFFNPVEYHFYPVCWFYRCTGLLCPGCGGLRAMHQLSHGHVLEALRLNAFAVAAIPFVAAYAWRRYRTRGQTGALYPRRTNLIVCCAVVLLVIFGVVRNLPGFDWLRP
ncbi:MAG: DUF2752 domain-containing protein [Verrucomicrobia bacterium]|nr:MAG: DUF2752 domain-containing protein [Verrucomicrobiota bacterium]